MGGGSYEPLTMQYSKIRGRGKIQNRGMGPTPGGHNHPQTLLYQPYKVQLVKRWL